MTTTKKLLLATRNPGKIRELHEILGSLPLTIVSLLDGIDAPEVVEDGPTFRSNALKKARAVFAATSIPSLADDSGLEVRGLHLRPGVHSARFAGEPVSYEANNRKLLNEMKNISGPGRRARFRCVVAFVAEGIEKTTEGVCEGSIALQARGVGGFGYDPLFVPLGHNETFAELPVSVKNEISHRARALRKMRSILASHFKVE